MARHLRCAEGTEGRQSLEGCRYTPVENLHTYVYVHLYDFLYVHMRKCISVYTYNIPCIHSLYKYAYKYTCKYKWLARDQRHISINFIYAHIHVHVIYVHMVTSSHLSVRLSPSRSRSSFLLQCPWPPWTPWSRPSSRGSTAPSTGLSGRPAVSYQLRMV